MHSAPVPLPRRTWLAACLLVALFLSLLTANVLAAPANPQPRTAATLNHAVYLPLMRRSYAFVPQTPNPLTLQLTLDSAHQQSKAIGQAGGTVTATGADGTQFILTIPSNSVFTTTTMSLTPIRAVTGLPGAITFVAGVHFEPEGLQLANIGKLTIVPTHAVPINQQVLFGSERKGLQTTLAAPSGRTAAIALQVTHFSELYLGDGIGIPILQAYPPQPTEYQVVQDLHAYLQQQRIQAVLGGETDPDYVERLLNFFEEYYRVALEQQLKWSATDCSTANTTIPKALAFERQMSVLGGENMPEVQAIEAAIPVALTNCWKQTTQPCLNRSNTTQMVYAQEYVLMGRLFGLNFDINSAPACNCNAFANTNTFHGTVSFTYAGSGSNADRSASVQHQGSVTVSYSRSSSIQWQATSISGVGQINDRYDVNNSSDHETLSGSGPVSSVGSNVDSGSGSYLTISSDCTYSLYLKSRISATYTSFGTSSTGPSGLGFLNLSGIPLQPNGTTLSGTQTVPVVWLAENTNLPRWFSPGGLMDKLYEINGSGYLGTATITWSVTGQ